MTDEEIIAVVQAHREGKPIQWRRLIEREHGCWSSLNQKDYARWNFYEFRYRVAPEPRKPREWIVGVTPDRHITSWRPDLMPHEVTETIQVREIID